jgi:hypothetical protein
VTALHIVQIGQSLDNIPTATLATCLPSSSRLGGFSTTTVTAHPQAVEAEAAGEVDVESAGEATVDARRQKLEGRRAVQAWELRQVQAELGRGGGTPQLDAEAMVVGATGQVHSDIREGWISL